MPNEREAENRDGSLKAVFDEEYNKGYEDGYEEGFQDGQEKGYREGRASRRLLKEDGHDQ